jgi:citrate lyase beta subunit
VSPIESSLAGANQKFARRYSGEPEGRQPIHVIYGGAHLFRAGTCRKLGELAQRAFAEYAPDPASLSAAVGVHSVFDDEIYARVNEKLRHEPVEDFRIDFEDGFGFRTGDEEDAAADTTARETAAAMAGGMLPPFFGIRIRPLNEEWRHRGFRTLRRFLEGLSSAGGGIPNNFVVTLPKITVPEQVSALVDALEPFPDIRIEMMIETPQALGRIPELIEAARGRCVAAHFGPYDYTASLGITVSRQSVLHPACDVARSLMQIHFAGTGIRLADGPTNTLPIPPHCGESLSPGQTAENRRTVHHAWRLHYRGISHSLDSGFYQGWDLHPAQLPTRYAAVYAFFMDGLEAASARLGNFIAQAAQATRAGGIFDDTATGQGLLNYFRRAVNCRAITEESAASLTGLTPDQMRGGSFAKIISATARVSS